MEWSIFVRGVQVPIKGLPTPAPASTPSNTPTHHTTMPGLLTLPPFPEDVPTHPLLVVDYQLIEKRDQAEIDKLWKAATELGFW